MQDIIVKASGISKSYGKTLALDSVSFEAGKAELIGFLGPDGGGKTSLFRILSTLLLPSAGIASLKGFDVVKDYREIRHILGYMPGRFSLYQDLTVSQNLNFYARIFDVNVADNYYLIKEIYSQLEPFKHRLAGKLSGGMKQKLALSCALIHKPEVLILDEPTTGVDAISRKEFWEMLKRLQKEGITILVSTPYMDEASLCDRVALVQQGRIMAMDEPRRIPQLFKGKLLAASAQDNYKLLHDLRLIEEVDHAYLFGQKVHFTHMGTMSRDDIFQRLFSNGNISVEIEEIKPGVEDCFISLMSNAEEK
ncbi:MAG: ABC transporter ATP-binding protein [Bacteroidota bacterium]